MARLAPLVRARRTHGVARHPGGQLLFVEKGRARVQERGGVRHELAIGESHYTAPDVEHWHGATPDSEFTQVALGRGDAAETVWLDKVTDERVRRALATATGRCTPRR